MNWDKQINLRILSKKHNWTENGRRIWMWRVMQIYMIVRATNWWMSPMSMVANTTHSCANLKSGNWLTWHVFQIERRPRSPLWNNRSATKTVLGSSGEICRASATGWRLLSWQDSKRSPRQASSTILNSRSRSWWAYWQLTKKLRLSVTCLRKKTRCFDHGLNTKWNNLKIWSKTFKFTSLI